MPAGRQNGDDFPRSMSMSGLLAMLVGGGLLLAYWKFSAFAVNFNSFERYTFVGVMSFLALWGLKQFIDARLPASRKSAANLSRRSGSTKKRLGWSISWVGILLILAGVELLLTIRTQLPDGSVKLFVILGGGLCILYGARSILATLLPEKYGNIPQYRVALPKPGAIYLLVMTVLLVGSLIGHSNMLMLVFAMMVGPFVLNGWITFSMLKKTGVSRRCPNTAIAGEPVTIDICLENRKRLLAATVMMVTDRIENNQEALHGRVLFSRVPSRSSKTESYRVCLMQRGMYRFGPLHLATRFPLGIVERRLIFPVYAELLVYPRIGRLTNSWRRGRSMTAEIVDRRSPARGSQHDEFHGMREFRAGDNPRAIHWRTSVRRNELTVREYQEHRSQNLMLLVDLWQPAKPVEADRERIELAISFASTLAVDHMQSARDARLDVVVAGSHYDRWRGFTGPTGLDPLLKMFALAEAGESPDVVKLAADAEANRSSGTRVIVLTTRNSQSELFEAIHQATTDGDDATFEGKFEVIPIGPDEVAPYFVLADDSALVQTPAVV